MKVYCINLERSQDRRRKMQAEFARIGLECEFLSAIDGRSLAPTEIKKAYSDWRTILRSGRSLSKGEIGCAMSHVEFFKRVIQGTDKAGFVFEDDVAFNSGVQSALAEVASFLEKSELPTLVQLPGIPRDLPKAQDCSQFFFPVMSAMGTYAYGINKPAAELLLRAFSPIKMPIDRYSYLIRHFGLRFYVYHSLVLDVDMCGNSTVGEERFVVFKGFKLFAYKCFRCLGVGIDAILSFKEWCNNYTSSE